MQRDAAIGEDLGGIRPQRKRAIVAFERLGFFAEPRLRDAEDMKRPKSVGLGGEDLPAQILGDGRPARLDGGEGKAERFLQGDVAWHRRR